MEKEPEKKYYFKGGNSDPNLKIDYGGRVSPAKHAYRLARLFFLLTFCCILGELLFRITIYFFDGYLPVLNFTFSAPLYFFSMGIGWFPRFLDAYVPKRPRWLFWLLTAAIGLIMAILIYVSLDAIDYPWTMIPKRALDRDWVSYLSTLFLIGYFIGVWMIRYELLGPRSAGR